MAARYPLWKYILILFISVAGVLLALPNIYGKSPAVQVQYETVEKALAAAAQLEKQLRENKLVYTGIKVKERNVNVFFASPDVQLVAKDRLSELNPEAKVAVNLLSNAPPWMEKVGLHSMNLGLDLRGGVSFLLQVDSKELFERKSSEYRDIVADVLSKQNLSYTDINADESGGLSIVFQDEEIRSLAINALMSQIPPEVERITRNENGAYVLHLRLSEQGVRLAKRKAADQNRLRMQGRVDALGVAEPTIQVVGDDRILVQLPGIQDVAQAKELLGSTATLEFYMSHEAATKEAYADRNYRPPFGSRLMHMEDGTPVVLNRRVIMTGEHIIDASSNIGQDSGQPEVNVVLDSVGGARMLETTRENIGKPMATVYVEYVPVNKIDADGKPVTDVEKRETVVNVATIQSQFSNQFRITGVTPMSRAQKLAATLRAGSLVAPVYIIEERTIGPSAGQENIDQGTNAAILGLILIMIFILVYYGVFGVFANIALVFNLILIVALLSWIGATLTLPGIGGIVLTLGMAVDANVLIFERIREEVDANLPTLDAIRMGFANAFSTIMDANLTTLIAAVLLFSFGTGPVKGFAVTLSIGILTSLFSAIYITRAQIEFFVLRRANPVVKL